MNTEREEGASAGKRAAASKWSGPAARVRQLLARVQHSQQALERLTRAAEPHVAALTPQLAILETTAFGTLPELVLERAATADEPVRANPALLPELHRDVPRAAAVPGAAVTSPQHTASAVVTQKPARPARPVPALRLRAPGNTAAQLQSTARRQQPVSPLTLHAAASSERAELRSEQPARSAAAVPEFSNPVAGGGRVVDLGQLVERVLRERGQTAQPVTRAARVSDALAREAAGSEPARASEAQQPARATHSPDVSVPSLFPRHTSFRLRRTLSHPAAATRWASDIPLRDVAPAPASDVLDLAAPFRRAEPVFYFDPLEPRPGADDSDDALTERINEVLREQARRQGVDLS